MIPLPQSAADDATAAIQARLDRGGLVRMQGRAVYTVRRPLVVRSDTDWLLDDDVEIVRGFSNGGETWATVRCVDARNVAIRGLRVRSRDATCTGKQVFVNRTAGLYVERLQCGATYADWATALKDCNGVRVIDPTFDCPGAMHQDGLHIYGGGDIVAVNVRGKVGDDLVAISAERLGDDGQVEQIPMDNVRVIGVNGVSTHANLVRIRRVSGAVPVRNIVVSDVAGECLGVGGIAIEGTADSPLVDVTLSKIDIDCAHNFWEGLKATFVRGLQLDRVTVRRPSHRPFYIDGCEDVRGWGLETDGPRLPDMQCVLVAEKHDCRGVRLEGDFAGATHHGIVLGTKAGRVTNWRLAGKVSGQRLTPLYRGNCDDGDASQLEAA